MIESFNFFLSDSAMFPFLLRKDESKIILFNESATGRSNISKSSSLVLYVLSPISYFLYLELIRSTYICFLQKLLSVFWFWYGFWKYFVLIWLISFYSSNISFLRLFWYNLQLCLFIFIQRYYTQSPIVLNIFLIYRILKFVLDMVT